MRSGIGLEVRRHVVFQRVDPDDSVLVLVVKCLLWGNRIDDECSYLSKLLEQRGKCIFRPFVERVSSLFICISSRVVPYVFSLRLGTLIRAALFSSSRFASRLSL